MLRKEFRRFELKILKEFLMKKQDFGREAFLKKGETKRVVRERKYKAGYILRDEYWRSHFEDKPEGHAILMKKQAYNLNGEWIGNSKQAHRLIVKNGIMPEKSKQDHCVCTIGYCKEKEMWYGWSHRAIQGFTYNNMLFDENWVPENGTGERGDCGFLVECEKIPFILRGSKKIKNLEQAKQAAINFAEYVS
jgi:hypothetical protein